MSGGPTISATLSDVIANVIALLVTVGDADYPHVSGSGLMEVLIGERYLREEGAAPRIVFVQTEDGGEVGGPIELGGRQVASVTETVRCYIWGAENTDDRLRYDDAKRRVMRLLNAFRATAPGRLKGARLVRGQDSNIVTYGEEFQFTIACTWPVFYDDELWAAAYAAAQSPAPSPPDPDRLDGGSGLSFATGTATLANTRPS